MGFRDTDLDDQVRAALRRDGAMPLHSLTIAVRNGIVYIGGSVNRQVWERTLDLVRRVESVAAVVDEMQVASSEV